MMRILVFGTGESIIITVFALNGKVVPNTEKFDFEAVEKNSGTN